MRGIAPTSYKTFTPEERFRLILAAGGRDDDTERDRLVGASQRVTRSLPDYYPYSQSFQELTLQAYMELLDLAALYLETLLQADAYDPFDDDEEAEDADEEDKADDGDGDGSDAEDEVNAAPDSSPVDPPGQWPPPASRRFFDMAQAAGFILKTKAAGWETFCGRMTVPPYLLWSVMPGYDRLQRALATAEIVAYDAAEFVRWRERTRKKFQPDGAAGPDRPLTAEVEADETEAAFRERVKWWGGE